MKRRRRDRERNVVFPWERRATVFAWLSRRYARTLGLAALGLVAASVLFSLDDRRRRVQATRAAIRSVTVATEAFRADHGRCPGSVEELVRPPEVAGISGRYLAELRLDGWGRPFQLRCPGWKHPSSADVLSAGPPMGILPAEPLE